MGAILIILYVAMLGFILLYSLAQVHLTILYLIGRRRKRGTENVLVDPKEWPEVTVQLPIYNERYVIGRLIDAVMKFDYPQEKLRIQVLDDSNDETLDIVAKKVKHYQNLGFNIEQVVRPERVGFKAGALQYGMELTQSPFLAIFDADFVPDPQFLKRTIPHFADPAIGVVQSRWEHINENYSLLTKMQAFALDAHFSVEQGGRNAAGHFINFNGTAGIWRRETIVEAGGWQADTLTEDLDLSYRAQLKGWRFHFLEELGSPAELPAVMSAIKSQQFRWTKGAAETARKNLGKVLRAKIPFVTKLHATFHLLNSFLFICILMTGILSVPLLFIKSYDPFVQEVFNYGAVFMLSLLGLISFFYVSRTARDDSSGLTHFFRFLGTFPVFLCVSMGFSLHNAIATFEGYIGKKSPFIRTPKFAIADGNDNWKDRTVYLSRRIAPLTLIEGLLSLYFLFGVGVGIYFAEYSMLPFHTLLMLGYGTIFYYSVRHSMASA